MLPTSFTAVCCSHLGRCWLGAVLLMAVPTVASAQLPAIRLGAIFPAGATPGSTVEVTIAGADLDDAAELQFSHAGIKATRKMAEPGPFDKEPQPVENTFVVTVAANVPLGIYEARALGKYGLSNARSFCIGDVPEIVEAEPNSQLEAATQVTLPVVVNGRSGQNADVDYFRFTAAAGQRVLARTRARQIDSRLDTVVTIYDAGGRQLGSSGDDAGRDSLVDFTAPVAGEYTLKIHDSAFQGSPEHYYRLSIGALPHIDFVFPPAGQAGGNRAFTLYGRNLPGGKPAGITRNGRPLEQLNVSIPLPGGAAAQQLNFSSLLEPASAGLDGIEYRIKGPNGTSNPVLVTIAAAPPVAEAETGNTPEQVQQLTLPCEVQGRFSPARDRDWYLFDAKAGESITVEVISQRLGLRTNPGLLVQQLVPRAEGQEPSPQQLAYLIDSGTQEGGSEFDVRTRDPVYHFSVPEDGTYRVMVHDAANDVLHDPRNIYRLVVNTGQPDFRLAAVPEGSYSGVFLRKGGQAGIRVVAFRRDGFDGEISVTATGLPAGVTCTDAIIGPSSHAAMLVLTAAPAANPVTGLIQIVGKSRIGNVEVTRTARPGAALTPTIARRTPNQVMPSVDARLTQSLAVSVSAAEQALVSLQAGGGKVWEASRGAQLKIPYTRGGTFKGPIILFPRGMSADVRVTPTNVGNGTNSGEVQLNLTAQTPTGTRTVWFDAVAQQVDYARNPEAAEAAKKRKQEVDQIKTKADADAKAATTAKTAADKAAAEAAAAVTAATNAKAAVGRALTAAKQAAAAAVEQAAQANAAAAASADDASLKNAAATAQKAAADAGAKVAAEMTKLVAAQKTFDTAVAKAKTADEAKAVADEKAAAATERARLAAVLKTQTDQRATALANAARPQKRFVPVVSTPVTLKITPAPVTLAEFKPAKVKQGEKLEIPLTITRLYGFNQQVGFSVVANGVGGLSIPNVAIRAGQSQGKVVITAAANAAPGEFELTVRGTMTLNGQRLNVEQPLKLVIDKMPEAAK